jgi:tetratricopeptide (TPR) repeat protein
MVECKACGAALRDGAGFCPRCGAAIAASETPAPPESQAGLPDPVAADATDSNRYRYWAFISYSSKDKAWADWLHRSIETYGIPSRLINHATPTGEAAPKRFRPVFRDRAELSASADLAKEIEEALRASRYLIVICSPAGARSMWVNKEIETFQRMGRAGRVLALIVDGVPHAGDERECLPAALLAAEPLAADARKDADGKDNARLKILAGMLGIGFDALKQREAHRRIRRLQIAIVIASVIAVGFAGIALYAEGQRVKAVKARMQAENLVGYMLFDLRDQLQPIGRLDIMQNTQAMVDQYYVDLGPEAGDATIARNHGVALNNKGNVLLAQGDVDGALREFRAALAIAENLVASDPSNSLWQSDVSLGHSKIGAILEGKGDLAGALSEYRIALEISQRAASANPKLAVVQWEVANRRSSIGRILEAQGDLGGALREYRTVLETSLRVAAADPGNSEWQGDLLDAHASVGRILEEQKSFAEGISEWRAALAIAETLAASEPDNTEWQQDMYWGHSSIGRMLTAQGDPSGALREHRTALAASERLVAAKPGDAGFQGDLYFAHISIGMVLWVSDDRVGARDEFVTARGILQRLLENDPDNTEWQTEVSNVEGYLATLSAPP